MPPLGYTLWIWLKNNPVARWVLGLFGVWVVFRVWLAGHTMRIRRGVRDEIERRAERAAREVIKDAERKTDDVVAEAERVRAGVVSGHDAASVPEQVRGVLFGDDAGRSRRD